MVKHSKVYSSTKWRLQVNIILRLIECLTPSVSFDIFMDNYFTFFCLLNHLGVKNIRATHVYSAKIGYANALLLRTSSCKKWNVATLSKTHLAKKQYNLDSGWLEQQHCNFHSFF